MDRITRIRIRNVRAIEAVDLDLAYPVTVLIGENGSGKSTIVECLEILRRVADPGFMQPFYGIHRGMSALLRKGAQTLELGVVIEDTAGLEPIIRYDLGLEPQGAGVVVVSERMSVGPTADVNASLVVDPELSESRAWLEKLRSSGPRPRNIAAEVVAGADPLGDGARERQQRQRETKRVAALVAKQERAARARNREPLVVIGRDRTSAVVFRRRDGVIQGGPPPNSDGIVLSSFGIQPPDPSFTRVLTALKGIEVHLPFDTMAAWAANATQRPITVRDGVMHFPADRLTLLGRNLANAWSELRNRSADRWGRTLELVRLGLGERVDNVIVTPDHGGGKIYLAIRFKDLDAPVFASDLSDGQLAWLSYVAMTELNSGRSLLVVDEPELHLHPALLGRAVSLLSNLEGGAPALLTTHSDRVLELLDNPADAVRVCSLDGSKAVVSRIDASELPQWLDQFGDLGQLRASGYLPRVLAPTVPAPPDREDDA